MNLIGKIFTVFILVMALVFAAFASAVYVTQRNWMKAAMETAKALENSRKERDDEKAAAELVKQNLEEKIARQAKDIARAETQNQELRDARVKNEKTIADQQAEIRDAVAAAKAAHEQLANSRTRITTLTEELKVARDDRDARFKEAQRFKDDLNGAQDEVSRLQKRIDDVVKELAAHKEFALYMKENPQDEGYKRKQPPVGSRGHVLAVQGSEMVEISLGSDMGIRKGHKLEVLRGAGAGAEYVGRIEVVQTAADKSVCRVLKEMLRKPMQRGDNVLSELN